MTKWILIFFALALLTGIASFSGPLTGTVAILQMLFAVFLVLLVISVISHIFRRDKFLE